MEQTDYFLRELLSMYMIRKEKQLLLTVLFVFLQLGIAMIVSCKKDPKPVQQTPGRLLLRVAEADNNRVDKFQYDQQGQVIKFFYYRGYGRDTAYQDYSYKNNLLHKITHYNAVFTA